VETTKDDLLEAKILNNKLHVLLNDGGNFDLEYDIFFTLHLAKNVKKNYDKTPIFQLKWQAKLPKAD
jgi:hypothetical protein